MDKTKGTAYYLVNERIEILKSFLKDRDADDWGYVDPYDQQLDNEIQFLEKLLDAIERG